MDSGQFPTTVNNPQGLTEFTVVHSYLNTVTKWGEDKYKALTALFTTAPGYPQPSAPAE
jgi:hypothetical protein